MNDRSAGSRSLVQLISLSSANFEWTTHIFSNSFDFNLASLLYCFLVERKIQNSEEAKEETHGWGFKLKIIGTGKYLRLFPTNR